MSVDDITVNISLDIDHEAQIERFKEALAEHCETCDETPEVTHRVLRGALELRAECSCGTEISHKRAFNVSIEESGV